MNRNELAQLHAIEDSIDRLSRVETQRYERYKECRSEDIKTDLAAWGQTATEIWQLIEMKHNPLVPPPPTDPDVQCSTRAPK